MVGVGAGSARTAPRHATAVVVAAADDALAAGCGDRRAHINVDVGGAAVVVTRALFRWLDWWMIEDAAAAAAAPPSLFLSTLTAGQWDRLLGHGGASGVEVPGRALIRFRCCRRRGGQGLFVGGGERRDTDVLLSYHGGVLRN